MIAPRSLLRKNLQNPRRKRPISMKRKRPGRIVPHPGSVTTAAAGLPRGS